MKAGNYIAAYIGGKGNHIEKGTYPITISEGDIYTKAGFICAVRWGNRNDQHVFPLYESQEQFDDNWIIISENPNGIDFFAR